MRRREFVVALSALGCGRAFAAEDPPIDGVWEFIVPNRGTGEKAVYLLIKKGRGPTAKIRDLQTGEEFTGMSGTGGDSITFVRGSAAGTFSGVIRDGTLRGQQEIAGEKLHVFANRLTGVYSCSNHRPSHIAKSKEDMEKNTREKQCQGWQRARPDSLG